MLDITVLMDTKVGRPAGILNDLAKSGIEIIAACLFPRLGGRVAHAVINNEDIDRVKEIIEQANATLADVRDCVVVEAGYEGGSAAIAAKVAEAGITVNVAYFGLRGEMILATADIAGTKEVLGLS